VDFESNKKLVQEITDVKYNNIRNRIAGYLVVLKKKEGRLILPPKKIKKVTSEKDIVKKQYRKWI